MTIYFINKNSKLKGPFDITDAHRNRIMSVGDVCIRECESGLSFLLICSDVNKWNTCKCVGTPPGEIGLEGNALLFAFDGISKRFGRKDELVKLYESFTQEPLHEFFQNAIDILTYKCDYWDVSLFVKIHQLSAITFESAKTEFKEKTPNHITRFQSYLPAEIQELFLKLISEGHQLRIVYKKIREQYPDEFRNSLKSFLKDNSTSSIYDK